MNTETALGFGLGMVILGGVLQGAFALPMKRMPAWRWENVWLVYAITGLLVFPWLLLWFTVPHPWDIFHRATGATLAEVIIFGAGWGVGSVLFGLGLSRVGMALTFAIVLGITAALGALLPLLVLHPGRLFTRQGYDFLAGLVLVLVGIALCSYAGHRRDVESSKAAGGVGHSGFWAGILICILSGIFSPMLNFSFAFGKQLQDLTLAAGAKTAMASNPIWALALAAGFVVNAGYCVVLLQKHRTWRALGQGGPAAIYWAGAALMGLLWFAGTMVYGVGAAALGPLGAVIGWPVFMAMLIVAGTVFGVATGEWKGARRTTHLYSWLSIAVLIVAIYVISRGGA